MTNVDKFAVQDKEHEYYEETEAEEKIEFHVDPSSSVYTAHGKKRQHRVFNERQSI